MVTFPVERTPLPAEEEYSIRLEALRKSLRKASRRLFTEANMDKYTTVNPNYKRKAVKRTRETAADENTPVQTKRARTESGPNYVDNRIRAKKPTASSSKEHKIWYQAMFGGFDEEEEERIRMNGRRPIQYTEEQLQYTNEQLQYQNEQLQYPNGAIDNRREDKEDDGDDKVDEEEEPEEENESQTDDDSESEINVGGPDDLIYSPPSTPFSIHADTDSDSNEESDDDDDESDSTVMGDDENSDTDD